MANDHRRLPEAIQTWRKCRLWLTMTSFVGSNTISRNHWSCDGYGSSCLLWKTWKLHGRKCRLWITMSSFVGSNTISRNHWSCDGCRSSCLLWKTWKLHGRKCRLWITMSSFVGSNTISRKHWSCDSYRAGMLIYLFSTTSTMIGSHHRISDFVT